DAQVGTTAGFVGDNIYNATGSQQSRSLTVHRTKTGTFSVKIANDGGLGADSFKVKGTGSGGGLAITYLAGATNVTAQVVAGTYAISNLAPGGSKTLTMKVKVASGAKVGSSRSFLVTATSSGGGSPKDAVKAVVKVS